MAGIRWIILIAAAINCALVGSIPIDNGVEGDPEIECGPNTITVNFNTRNNFEGHVFVKGRYGEPGCRSDQTGKKIASLSLPFSTCGIDRQRSLNPKGLFVGVSVVITFHPQFLTKVDRAYSVQCFYMEADKTVSQDLEVSEITTAFQTQNVPMPVCRYDILDGGPNGEPLKFGSIGQQVYHKWTCETESIDIFCMLVHTCFVDDGSGNKVQVVNEQGCALDKFIINNLEYISDLMAGKEAHIFKFADRPALFFACQISISIKEPGQDCPRPQCAEAGGLGPSEGSVPPRPPTSPAVPGSTGTGRPSTGGRTPPLGRTVAPTGGSTPPGGTHTAGGTSPKVGGSTGTPNAGSPRPKAPPSATPPSGRGPPSGPPGAQPTPPGNLPVLVNGGRNPAPGALLALGRSTAKPSSTPTSTRASTSTRSDSTSRSTSRSTTTRTSLSTGTTSSSSRLSTSSRTSASTSSSSSSTRSTTESHARTTSSGSSSSSAPLLARPGVAAPAPPAPPAPAVNAPGPVVNSFNLPAVTSAPIQNGQRLSSVSSTLQPPPATSTSASGSTGRPGSLLLSNTTQSGSRPAPPAGPARPGDTSQTGPRFDFESTFPFRLRRVRSVDRVDYIGTWDVRAPPLNTYEDWDSALPSNELQGLTALNKQTSIESYEADHMYCVPTILIGLIVGVTLLSLLASIVVALFLCLRRRGEKYYVD